MSVADPPDPDDPIDDYLKRLERKGRGPRTVGNYDTALNYHLDPYLESNGLEPGEMTVDDCEEFLDVMNAKPEVDGSSFKGYARKIKKFYQYYNSRGTFEVNPMDLAMKDYDFPDDPEQMKREIDVPEMADFIQGINHPLLLAILMLLLKTGIRVGELCNLDMRDVHINDPRVRELFPELRDKIVDKPDSIYIERHPKMKTGLVVNGEKRTESNKRKRATTIPIDEELKKVLVLWLAVRPESRSPAMPFLTKVQPGPNDTEPGDRLTEPSVHRLVTNKAEDNGWWDSDADYGMNVTPHYFRHFFTTWMEDRTRDPTFVQFIRGDKGGDAMDQYLHNWGDRVRNTYLENIYKLLR